MKSTINHIAAFFLLVVMAVPILTPSVMQLQQLYVQWQMQEKLEKQALVTVTVKTKNIRWIKKDKECMIHGEMFDIKKHTVKGNETLLTGLYDVKEKAIKQMLSKQAKQQQGSGHHLSFIKLFSVIGLIQQPIDAPGVIVTLIHSVNTFYTPQYKTRPLSVIAPPPRC